MKISWPWRKKKPLSLFEKPMVKVVAPNLRNQRPPHPLNAPGPFYVENDECIACGAPHAVAPDLMAWTENPDKHPGRTHCYFTKQPQDETELREALDAIAASCCGALRYAGSDKEVLKAIRKSGNAGAIVRK